MIRVLQVFSMMNRGGSETMIMNYYRNMDRTKVQFDFVVHTDKKCAYDDEIKSLGGQIFYVPFFKGYNLYSYQKAWNIFFQTHSQYKVIHIHYFTIAGLILPIAKKYNLSVRIVHSHISTDSVPFLRLLRLHLLRPWAILHATDRFACSADAGVFFFRKHDFVIMNNAIDAEKFIFSSLLRNEKRSELGLKGKFVIGHIGRFQTQKNHSFIIDIFKEVCVLNKNAVLVLVGEGSLKKSIMEKVSLLGLTDKVIFTGVRSDIPELLQAMDVFLFPSLYEGLGIVAVESQAAGLRTIISDNLPKEVYVTKLCEGVSLNEKPKVWAEKVNGCDNNYQHEDTFVEMCKAGYDIHENAKWLEEFYLEKSVK